VQVAAKLGELKEMEQFGPGMWVTAARRRVFQLQHICDATHSSFLQQPTQQQRDLP
jgi:hypothetical protein